MTAYIFDISTSARWSGYPVGIVRAERELARRARKHLGSDVAFSVYDLATNRFLILHDHWVEPILNGDLTIDFASHHIAHRRGKLRRRLRNLALQNRTTYRLIQRARGIHLSSKDVQALREQLRAVEPRTQSLSLSSTLERLKEQLRGRLRNVALKTPAIYRLIQRARGLRLSSYEVLALRERMRADEANSQSSSANLALARATMGPAKLDSETVILSGGLDWEHKNVRQIYHLKQKEKFRYFSIIYDLIPIFLPHYVVPSYVALLTEYFGELLWASDGYLCISESTRNDLHKFCDDNNVYPPLSQSFPLGSDLTAIDLAASESEILPDSLRGKKYVLYVSTIEPRKNHRTAYEAWCLAIQAGKLDPKRDRLVFVGRQGWNVGDLVHEIETNPISRDTVLRLSDVSDALLGTLYKHCAFAIFPSYYEGFGLPLVEAFAYGKVCVTSGAGALKEIGPSVRIDIDPRDIVKWSSTMSELLTCPDKLSELERKIAADCRPVSWDDSANEFFETVKKWSAA